MRLRGFWLWPALWSKVKHVQTLSWLFCLDLNRPCSLQPADDDALTLIMPRRHLPIKSGHVHALPALTWLPWIAALIAEAIRLALTDCWALFCNVYGV